MSNPSSLTSQKLITNEVHTNRLVLNGIETSDIVQEIDKDSSDTSLVTVGAITPLTEKITFLETKLDPSNAQYQDQTVMTISLTDQYFNKPSDFVLENWLIDSNTLYGLGGNTDNSCAIANRVYTKPGVYYVSLTITNLPSGTLKVYFNDKLLQTITEANAYNFEIVVTDIANDRFYIQAENLNNEERLIISQFALYFITNRFHTYLVGKIKELASIDPSNYVTWTDYWEEMKKYIGQFEASANIFIDQLKEHTTADNPHGITLEKLGGAPAEHTHEQYVTNDNFNNTLTTELAKYALKNHLHDDRYVTQDQIGGIVEDTVGDRFNEIITIPPALVVLAPTGRLPSRFMRTSISEPLTILLPSQLNPTVNSNYSDTFGIVITNCEDIIEDCSLAFLLGSEGTNLPPDYDYSDPLILKLQFHTYRNVRGYKLTTREGTVNSWKVYTGNNTFIHQIDEHTPDDTYYFDAAMSINGLTFAILDAEQLVYGLKIELLMLNQDLDTMYITKESFTVSIPDRGSNRLVVQPKQQNELTIKLEQEKIADEIPCFLIANYVNKSLGFTTTWIRPEYGETRIGIEVFTDRFSKLSRDPDSLYESYKHPALGTLTLLEGLTKSNGQPLTKIYDKTYDSWYTDQSTRKVTIEQTVNEDNVLLRGYLLNWRKNDSHRIPNTWTLMVEGIDQNNHESTVVIDSVENYFPCYSAEDDDIVYTKSCELNMHVKKLILTMVANEDSNAGLGLNEFIPYLSKYYYSAPENTMYNGMLKTASLCLGYYRHYQNSGWIPTNLCLGKTVVVPLNDLDPTEPSTEYVVPNPFLSINITINISIYKWMDDQASTGSAEVIGITDTAIKVLVIIPATYCLTITRRW